MFRLLPRIPLPHLLRTGPEPIDESFLEQPLDRGLENRVRTLAAKARMSPEITDRLVAGHVAADAAARIEVSRPDQVRGLRRLILMGPAYHQKTTSITMGFGDEIPVPTDDSRSPLTLIGVTGDGRLFRRGLYTREGAPSPSEGLRIARHAPDRLLPGIGAADPGLNRYNGAGSSAVRDTVNDLLSRTMSDLSRTEREAVPYGFLMGLEHVTRLRVSRRVALARYALNDALDPDLLRMMRGCALQSVAEAEWVFGAVSPDPERTGPGRWFGVETEALHNRDLSSYRVQAVRAYPALARKLFAEPGFRRAIDERAPLAPVVADYLKVRESGVRILRGVSWQMAGVTPSEPRWGLARLASVPADLVPVRRSEHRQLPLIAGFSDLLNEGLPETMRRFARGGAPYRFEAELKRVSPGDVRDAAEYLVDKLLLPARRHAARRLCEADGLRRPGPDTRVRRGMVAGVLRTLSARDLFALSDRWHRNFERHEDRLVTLRSEVSWPPFLTSPFAEGEVRVRELTSSDALQRQGRVEGHCVGGYTENVLRAGSGRIPLIFSIERGGEVLGTAEIRLLRGEQKAGKGGEEPPWEAHIIQNRGRHNGPVCAHAERTAEVLCRALERIAPERAEPYHDGLRRVRGARSRHGDLPEHLKNAGYDVWETGRLEAAWEELSGYLQRGVRRAGLEALIRADGEQILEAETQSTHPPPLDHSKRPAGRWAEAGREGALRHDRSKAPFWELDAEAVRRFNETGPDPVLPDPVLPDPETDEMGDECPF